jgi:hypothetical protein
VFFVILMKNSEDYGPFQKWVNSTVFKLEQNKLIMLVCHVIEIKN